MEQGLLLWPLAKGCFCRKEVFGSGSRRVGNKYPALQFLSAFIGGSNQGQEEREHTDEICPSQPAWAHKRVYEAEYGPRGANRTYSASLVTTGTV